MAFGKRAAALKPQSPYQPAAAARPPAPRRDDSFVPQSARQEALLEELRVMARQTGAQTAKTEKVHGSIGGRLVKDHGPDANPVLALGEGVADGSEVRRGDYWSSNLLANFSALIGFGGGLALGLSAHGAIGFMFVVWGLTAVATGRMMIPRRFMGSKVYLGQAARLAGLGVAALGAFLIVRYWSEPSPFAGVVPNYEPPLHRVFGDL